MFKKAPALPPDRDYTLNLRETSFYRYGHLRSLGVTGEITAIAVDPVLSLFAVGTSSGIVHVYGQPAFQFSLPVGTSSSVCAPIKFLLFHPGHHRLVVIDESNTLHTFSLAQISDHPNPLTHPPLPVKEGSYTLWGTITAVEQPLPSYTHLFMTMKDGSTLSWDLSRRILGNWKIGNCWLEHEERMIRSGIPGRNRGGMQPMATCIAMNPRDLNIILIGYDGGVVAWNIQKSVVEKTFEMTLPPGAPGGGTYLDAESLWTERTPSVTCITWRPDGLIFVVGHSDGCMTFWAYSDADKPLMVRTITHEDVNVTDANELFTSGALDGGQAPKKGQGVLAVTANREPIFKLAWASFPDQASLKALMAAQGTEAAGEPLSNATVDYSERGETLLLILGGQSPGERPGINILQFPAFVPPPPPPQAKAKSPVISEGLPVMDRYAFRDSLAPTGTSNFVTRTPPEDFILVPRSSPYFALAHDPISLIISLTPDDKLSKIDSMHARRGLEAYRFPPPRSGVVPPSPGRKNYVIPGEGENIVAMTPAPVSTSRPTTPRSVSPSFAGWKLPWSSTGSAPPSPKMSPTMAPQMTRGSSASAQSSSSSRGSPLLRVPTSDSNISARSASPSKGPRRVKERRRYRLPSSIWSGNMTVLGCEICSLPTPTFKRLISWSIEFAGDESVPRLPLHGGMAVPDLQSHGAPEVKVAKLESYRIMMTYHSDATVRFWDISPHLLLLPTPLRFEYPGPLPHLTISLGEYLTHSDVAHLPLAQLWRDDRSKVRIVSVHLAREALECTITMSTGEVIITKFQEGDGSGDGDEGREPDEQDGYFPKMELPSRLIGEEEQSYVEEITEIGHLAKKATDGFKPISILTLKRGSVTKCAVSDIGFIAVAFATRSLTIVDMRGPDIILREGFDAEGATMKKKKKGNVQNVPGETSDVAALKWVVAGLGADPTPRPRLIVSYSKGMTKIYTVVNVLGEWIVETKPPTFTNDSLSNPIASFVLDPHTGNELHPTAESLQKVISAQQDSPGHEHKGKDKDAPAHCIWIAVSRKSIRAAVNFNGDKVGKVELDEDLSEAFYITRHGKKVLVVVTTNGTALFYALPFLEFITRLDLYYGHNPRPTGRMSMDDRSGDFIEHLSPLDINLRTLFHFRKPFPPRLDPCSLKRAVPPQPQPLSASYFGWIWGAGALTGAQLDSIVAGPARPPPPPPPPAPRKPLISWGEPPPPKQAPKVEPAPDTRATTLPKRTAVAKTKSPIQDAREREDAYSEMRRAAEERGNFLDNLGDSLNNVHVSTSNYLSSARNTAMKEAAKGTAKSMFGKLL